MSFRDLAAMFAVALMTLTGIASSQESGAQVDQPSAERLIEARCSFCHGSRVLSTLSQRKLSEEGQEALDLFLTSHHAPDAEARETIVRFLASKADLSN
jgi:cytochrome c553